MTDDLDDFRSEVEAFLRDGRLTASAFGDKAAGDSNFVSDLRAGRECRKRTRERVRAFMARQSPVSRETTRGAAA